MKTFGEIIREKRKAMRLSQYALAKKLCTTQQTVCYWETDKSYPTALMLVDIADVFDCSIDDLFGRTR